MEWILFFPGNVAGRQWVVHRARVGSFDIAGRGFVG